MGASRERVEPPLHPVERRLQRAPPSSPRTDLGHGVRRIGAECRRMCVTSITVGVVSRLPCPLHAWKHDPRRHSKKTRPGSHGSSRAGLHTSNVPIVTHRLSYGHSQPSSWAPGVPSDRWTPHRPPCTYCIRDAPPTSETGHGNPWCFVPYVSNPARSSPLREAGRGSAVIPAWEPTSAPQRRLAPSGHDFVARAPHREATPPPGASAFPRPSVENRSGLGLEQPHNQHVGLDAGDLVARLEDTGSVVGTRVARRNIRYVVESSSDIGAVAAGRSELKADVDRDGAGISNRALNPAAADSIGIGHVRRRDEPVRANVCRQRRARRVLARQLQQPHKNDPSDGGNTYESHRSHLTFLLATIPL